MKTETEKSIEQIALQNYVWENGTAKFFKNHTRIGLISGSIIFIICVVLYAYDSLIWNEGSVGIIISLVLCLFPAGFVAAFIMAFHSLFIDLYRGKRKRRKIIARLSLEEKRKITKEYLNSEVQKWNKNIAYCENQIQPFQKSIEHHKKEIEKLELELSKFN